MTVFEVVVGLATIGSFIVAYRMYRSSQIEGVSTSSSSNEQSELSTPPEEADDTPKPCHPAVMIPDGVALGDKVVLVPGLQQRLFTQAGRIEENIWSRKSYSWIERGEVIGRYHMSVPNSDADYLRHVMGAKDHTIDIRSPVSGLLLHSFFSDFVEWPKRDHSSGEYRWDCFGVLIPDDEPPPEKNRYMFGELIRFIRQNSGPFFRESPYWSLGPMDQELFERLIAAQEAAECVTVEAMPRYTEYVDDARIQFSALRPYLKHLR